MMKETLRDRPLLLLTRFVLAGSFVAVGIHHFVNPTPYLMIMPPYLPWHLELVYISGVFEVMGGVGLLIPSVRRQAAWGLIALLVAVYPANIHMLMNKIYLPDMPKEEWILWMRMPLQFVFALGVLWTGELWPKRKTVMAPQSLNQ